MFAGAGAAEAAGDVERIARTPAAAEDAAFPFDGAGEGDVEEKRAGRARGFAADDADAETARGPAQAGVERGGAGHFQMRRRGEGDERVLGHAAHCGDVAEL